MIELSFDKNLIRTTASGKLEKEDYETLLPVVNDHIKKYGKVRWYFEMKDFEGWDTQSFLEDVKFDLKNSGNFEKIAMVGDSKWQKLMTDLMKVFFKAEIKYFPLEEDQKALEWIRSSRLN